MMSQFSLDYFSSFECKLKSTIIALTNLYPISDSDFVNYYKSCKVKVESPTTYSFVVGNIMGNNCLKSEPTEFESMLVKMVDNDLVPALGKFDVALSELGDYFLNLGENFLLLVQLVQSKVIRKDQSKEILELMLQPTSIGSYLIDVIETMNPEFFVETNNDSLLDLVKLEISKNERAVAEFKSGKERAIMSIVGAIMKQQKTDAKELINMIKSEISKT